MAAAPPVFLLANLALAFYLVGAIWAIWGNLTSQLASHVLTAILWGPWQAALSRDNAGANSVHLGLILRTYWIRTFLINAYGTIMLVWAIRIVQ